MTYYLLTEYTKHLFSELSIYLDGQDRTSRGLSFYVNR